ncbi:MAG: LruC domain-containing protein [Nitritalea sp.]
MIYPKLNTTPIYRFLSSIVLLGLGLAMACSPDDGLSVERPDDPDAGFLGLQIPPNFLFQSEEQVRLEFRVRFSPEQAAAGVPYSLFTADPDAGGQLITRFRLNEGGTFNGLLALPSTQDSIWLSSSFPGVESFVRLPVQQGVVRYERILSELTSGTEVNAKQTLGYERAQQQVNGFFTLGAWRPNGTPEYLLGRFPPAPALLNRVAAALPEGRDVRVHSPELLGANRQRVLTLQEDTELFVTVLKTGNGNRSRNALGYYYYGPGDRPQTMQDVLNRTIIFPHVHNGILRPGDRVRLEGPNGAIFPAGTRVGFIFIADSWQNAARGLEVGSFTAFTENQLNTFITNPALRDQGLFLYDIASQSALLAWEETRRDSNQSDHDFNDNIFQISAGSPTALQRSGLSLLGDGASDSDGDGVPDFTDDFPNDPERAFRSYYPSEEGEATLMFEDLWPFFGDYDMNDLVLGYRVEEHLDANQRISRVRFHLRIRATGAGFRTGFGIQFQTPTANVRSVTGAGQVGEITSLLPTGAEAGQRLANVIFFEDANAVMPEFSNVLPGQPPVEEQAFTVDILFEEPVSRAVLGSAPYNPYTFRRSDRSHEIHLPGQEPTDKFNRNLFGRGDDNSSFSAQRFFLSRSGLNWAINVPAFVPHLIENADLTEAYRDFPAWARSGGNENQNWFKQNINNSLIFSRP